MKIVIFDGVNEDAFFVEVNNVINKLELKQKIETSDLEHLHVFVMKIENGVINSSTIKKIEIWLSNNADKEDPNLIENLNCLVQKNRNNIKYYLHIMNRNHAEGFDVIPLRYFTILRRKYPDKIYLGIEEQPGKKGQEFPDRNRIASYMFLDSLCNMNKWESMWTKSSNRGKEYYSLKINNRDLRNNSFYNQIYMVSNRATTRLVIHNKGSFNKIIPCIYLDWEWQTIFSNSVCMYIDKFEIKGNDYKDDVPIKEDYIYKIQKAIADNGNGTWILLERYYNKLLEKQWKKCLYTTIIKDICIDNLEDAKVLKTGKEKEAYTLVKDMSMLSMLLFSSFCHFIYDTTKKELQQVEIHNLFQAAQDFAEGLLQLMENALDYSEGSCFSFRIHSGSSNYFVENYQEVVIEEETYYLEVLITDINYNNNLPGQFVETLKERASLKELPNDLVEKMTKQITLSGFFEPDKEMQKLWNEYYMIAENATNHYGLQLFNTLVNYYQGYFEVDSVRNCLENYKPYSANYGKKNKNVNITQKKGIPGTQYNILLPIKKREEQKRIGIHLQPTFDDVSLKKKWKNILLSAKDVLDEIDEKQSSDFTQNRNFKKKNIKMIVERLEQFYQKNAIFVIDLNLVNYIKCAEFFSKAMMSFVLHHQSTKLRIALINADHNFMLEYTRFFAIFYNKNAKCHAMKNTQLFICDKEIRTEITFAGDSLSATCAGNELWANAKGEYDQCLEMLQIILKQRVRSARGLPKAIRAVPFDLLVKENNITLFEKQVYNDLLRNIQREQFGCLLKDIHMRVGAKMHITDMFYETFQLFNSSLYNTRFAYLLAERIRNKITEKKYNDSGDLVLVGYDVYSELLILETKKMLENLYGISVRSVIYEQFPHPDFRMWKADMKNSKFVIIVPTNTTLTTHGKVIVELARKAEKEDISSSILLNMALILIRDSSIKTVDGKIDDDIILPNNLSNIESNYWNAIQDDNNIREVRTKTTKPENISYFVLVQSHWEEPLKCESCYPKNSLLDEKPIIEVNRASVVPMIMAGPQESSLKNEREERISGGDVVMLKDVMYYRHVRRKNNHFLYYFKTDELMQVILENEIYRGQFTVWIENVKKRIKKQRKSQDEFINKDYQQSPYIYDFLVAPIHETNAMFLERINGEIFEGVPIILYIDSDREYRENILSKYSNLTALYNNIKSTGRRAVINFHYIDDSINSGVAFRRTHNLLQTLFPEEAYLQTAQVRVNLFQNIIILLNRNSKGSIKGFTHKGEFFSFLDINVSSLRNHHENACAICSELSSYQTLQEKAAINSMALYWKNKIKRKEVVDVGELNDKTDKKDRYFRRLMCTHEINQSLNKMKWDRNNPKYVAEKIKNIILNRVNQKNLSGNMKMEYIMAYFSVLSRPYLSYRKSILDVVFPMFLKVMERILEKGTHTNSTGGNNLEDFICNEFWRNKSSRIKKNFITVMIGALSRLDASYLIRVQVLNRIFLLAKTIQIDINEFELFYGSAIKRHITLGKDESSGLWLEYLVIKGHEFEKDVDTQLTIRQDFKDFLFYENIYIIADAIEELLYKKVNNLEDINKGIDEYYFDNFRMMINIDYLGEMERTLLYQNKTWDLISKMLLGMVQLRKHLLDESFNTDNYYFQLLKYVKAITNAKYVCLYGVDKGGQIYIISSSTKGFYNVDFLKKIERARKENGKIANYLKDSVYFYSNNKVFLCLTERKEDGKKENGENIDTVWLMLEFDENDNGLSELLCDRYKFATRNILVHRYLLWKRLRDDFRKDAFQRIKELSMKNELLSVSKSGSHTPDIILKRIEKNLKSLAECNDETMMVWASSLLQLAADSLISKLYVESVREKDVKRNEKVDEKNLSQDQFDFSDIIKTLLCKMAFVNKNKKESEPTYADISVSEDAQRFKFCYPNEKRFYNLYIVAAIVQNAVKHGKAENNNTVKIDIHIDGEFLVFENDLKKGYELRSKEDKEGITLPALEYYFDKYYPCKMFMGKEEGQSKYKVKIPVVRKNKSKGEY